MSIYVASRLTNFANVINLQNKLRDKDWIIQYDWAQLALDRINAGLHIDSDKNKSLIAEKEIDAASQADVFLLYSPGHLDQIRAGAYVELGAALSSGIKVIVYCQEMYDILFYYHPSVRLVRNEEEMWKELERLEWLKN